MNPFLDIDTIETQEEQFQVIDTLFDEDDSEDESRSEFLSENL